MLQAPGTTEIALRPFKVGGHSLEPGDKFSEDIAELLEEIHITRLRRQDALGPLTKDTYLRCMSRRPKGAIGKGFTRAELVARGILTEGAGLAPAPDPTASPKDPLEGARPYKAFFIREKAVHGRFKLYDVLDAKGELLRVSAFKKPEKAEAFLDALSTDSAASDTPSETKVEPEGNDGDVQPQPH